MEENNQHTQDLSQNQSKRTWVLVGLYLGAVLLGWGGSFAGSQYVERTLSLPENAQLEGFEKIFCFCMKG